MRILVIDNYDSFVYNLVHYLGQLGAHSDVLRNDADELTEEEFVAGYAGVLVSPGPSTPERAGHSMAVIQHCVRANVALFGVCLGHQAIGAVWGGVVESAPELLHGKTSVVQHKGTGVFVGVPNPITATRYHSLAVRADTIPDEFDITAQTDSGIVMGMRHRELPIEGVQFHPESVLTEYGHRLLANWLRTCGHEVPEDVLVGLEETTHRLIATARLG